MNRLFFISLCSLILFYTKLEAEMIYDFNKNKNLRDWQIINDGVMGGLSFGRLRLSENGNGLFYGFVSLENYGGFTSVRLRKKVKLNKRLPDARTNFDGVGYCRKNTNNYFLGEVCMRWQNYVRHVKFSGVGHFQK